MDDERKKRIMGITPELEENLKRIRNKIAVLSGKGGVGKSTVSVNLAFALSEAGFKTGVMDADIHGPNIAKMLSIENHRLLSDGKRIKPIHVTDKLWAVSMALAFKRDEPVAWRGPLKTSAIRQFLGEVEWPELDFLIIDMPPGTGDEAITVAQLVAGCSAVIVTTPQEVALLDSMRAARFAKESNMNVLGVIENMSGFACPHCGKEADIFKKGNAKKAAEESGIEFLGSIPLDPYAVTSTDSGLPAISNEKSPAGKALRRIAEKIISLSEP
ncbi:ATP-binding protein [Candidatus Woesearchaeota archaeon]|nr:MAG: ATP-binding protein [Candidatus Woesearchaeota archaeon]